MIGHMCLEFILFNFIVLDTELTIKKNVILIGNKNRYYFPFYLYYNNAKKLNTYRYFRLQ